MLKQVHKDSWLYSARGFHAGDIINHENTTENFHSLLVVDVKMVEYKGTQVQAVRLLNLADGILYDWCRTDVTCQFHYITDDD